MYWRFDEGIQHVELDYPRDLSMWKGVPENFDAVFQVNKNIYYVAVFQVKLKFSNLN